MAWAEAAMKRGDYAVTPGVLGLGLISKCSRPVSRRCPLPRGTIVCSWFCAAEAADVHFSTRPFRAKRFQTIHDSGVDVALGPAALSVLGTTVLGCGFLR